MSEDLLLNNNSPTQESSNQDRKKRNKRTLSYSQQQNLEKQKYEKSNKQFECRNRKRKINKQCLNKNITQNKYNLRATYNNEDACRKITEETDDQLYQQNKDFSQIQLKILQIEFGLKQNVEKTLQSSNQIKFSDLEKCVKNRKKNLMRQFALDDQQKNNLQTFLKLKFENLEKKLLKGLNDSRLRQKGRPRKDENYIEEAKKEINGEFEVIAQENDIQQSNAIQQTQLKKQEIKNQDQNEKSIDPKEEEKPRKTVNITVEELIKTNVVEIDDEEMEQRRITRLSLFDPQINTNFLKQIEKAYYDQIFDQDVQIFLIFFLNFLIFSQIKINNGSTIHWCIFDWCRVRLFKKRQKLLLNYIDIMLLKIIYSIKIDFFQEVFQNK